MKKLFLLSAAALAISATPALADNHGDKSGKMFEKHDTNGDGVVSEAEFLDHAKQRFAEMDTDGNGEISQEEAKAQKEARKEKMKEKREKWKEKREENHDHDHEDEE